ncbi:MAG: hypothetical protein JWN03_3252 [Nocardia sp.]|uniref:hypothetical protein n=1 Tax=Nocardia sp. TaxID=1821 RepID=UPI002609FA64|nr:hypothetical protein [Nocardia sp.]MCU1642977.1 hypothetical protein [Nocardia sp.]
MEFYGPRLQRLEDCHVRDHDIEMTAAEALEAIIIHRECLPSDCSRQVEATRIIGVEVDQYVDDAKVIPLRTRHFKVVGYGSGDP